jgi:hypothetical protein
MLLFPDPLGNGPDPSAHDAVKQDVRRQEIVEKVLLEGISFYPAIVAHAILPK